MNYYYTDTLQRWGQCCSTHNITVVQYCYNCGFMDPGEIGQEATWCVKSYISDLT